MRLFPFLVDEPSRDNNLMQGITRENARFLLRYFCIGSSERANLTRTKRIRHSGDPKVPAQSKKNRHSCARSPTQQQPDEGGRILTHGEERCTRGETTTVDGMNQVVDLDALALRAAGGDVRALDHLLTVIDTERLARPAIRSLIVDDTDADDLAQDVLIKVSSGITTFQGNAKFTTWLYTVARNCAINHLRRNRADVELRDDDVSPTQRVSSIISSRHDIEAALSALPEHYRNVVVLRDVDGLSYADIAQRLGIEVGTVRSRLARGRAMAAQTLLAV